ncbi:hypothetical protein BASA81_013399 [Batrachochytrium salamandrivorans]|nr:hypothetical protein BASA81_013399 [Batrachochytrium salamandrivorans]
MSKEQETNAMLVMRTLSNMFSQEGYHSAIYDQRQKFILYSAELVKKSENKNLRISLATLYLNLVVLMCKQAFSFDDAVAVDVLESLNTMLVNETDGEALFRELVAIGTILAHSARSRSCSATRHQRHCSLHAQKSQWQRSQTSKRRGRDKDGEAIVPCAFGPCALIERREELS